MDPRVDEFLDNTEQWQEEMRFLRSVVLECGLQEDFKWKHPCYTHNGKNVVLYHGFKDYFALMFWKGALLKDEKKLLRKITENVQAERQFRFANMAELQERLADVKAYIFEAIEVEKQGLKVKMKEVSDYEVPQELLDKFEESEEFKSAFESLTPGRQKGYLLHFAQAKQSTTRTARIENYRDRIMMGKGMRDCICGHSKRMPNCDGSHKHYTS